ncbi:hypothetical protein BKA23_2884 [Rudaeicoccus suwonensis]|uniref:Uncharacterized protein n=1 Tax=Rudaeicoccus suwonensis TaxID=657409 RepID=A0A561E4H0_9MICO|nr:hypothetical protein BKA23_2884 [Rudaeicoccus suwonensis]
MIMLLVWLVIAIVLLTGALGLLIRSRSGGLRDRSASSDSDMNRASADVARRSQLRGPPM